MFNRVWDIRNWGTVKFNLIVTAFLFFALQWKAQSAVDTIPPDVKINLILVLDPSNGAIRFSQLNDSTFQMAAPGPSADWYRLIANILQSWSFAIQSRINDAGTTIWTSLKTEINAGTQHFVDESKRQIILEAAKMRDTLKQELHAFLLSNNTQKTIARYKRKEMAETIFYSTWSFFFVFSIFWLIAWAKYLRKK